jgi:hypothetical protein
VFLESHIWDMYAFIRGVAEEVWVRCVRPVTLGRSRGANPQARGTDAAYNGWLHDLCQLVVAAEWIDV